MPPDTNPPTPPAPATPTTGDLIGQDIATADAVLTPILSAFNPAFGTALHLGLKLVSVAEPAVYAAAVAILQGTPLTPEQETALKAAETKLQNPESYFA